jgi:import inner membrane translocase subunit TIM16
MAFGPLGRVVAQVVIAGVAVLARAIPAAYGAALQNARKSGADKAAEEAARKGASFLGKARISKDEALMVLNLSEGEATAEAIQKQYDRYFEANKVEKGGSFYLQSKIYRAKELLDEYVKEKNAEMMKGQQQGQSSSSGSQQQQDQEGKTK